MPSFVLRRSTVKPNEPFLAEPLWGEGLDALGLLSVRRRKLCPFLLSRRPLRQVAQNDVTKRSVTPDSTQSAIARAIRAGLGEEGGQPASAEDDAPE